MNDVALDLIGVRRRRVQLGAAHLSGSGVLRTVARRNTARIGMVVLAVVLGFVALVPILSSQSIYAQTGVQLQAPSAQHWFGTDQLGRDLMVRLAAGGRTSLGGAVLALTAAVTIGLVVGVAAASGGRRLDAVLMRAVDAANGIPPLIIPIALVGALGPTYSNLLLAIVISFVPSYARVARTFADGLRSRLDIVSAHLLGVSKTRIAATHILPAVFTQMLVIATLDVGSVVVALSGLSFVGLGAQAPTPEWGVLLDDGQMFFTPAPWLLIFPALAITLVIIASNLLGESIRDVLAERDGR